MIDVVFTQKINLFVTDGSQHYRIFCLFFRKDGGFNVSIPGYKIKNGVIGECILKDSRIDLKEKGKAVSSVVKFAYPQDGKVHFSESGKIFSEFKTKNTLTLDENINQLFGFYSQGYKNFLFEEKKRNSSSKEFSFYFDFSQMGKPESFRVLGRWYKKDQEKISPTKICSKYIFQENNLSSAQLMYSIAITPYEGKYSGDSMLVLSFEPVFQKINAHREDHIFLIGGFDNEDDLKKENTDLLMFSYPAIGDGLPNIDFPPK